MGLDYRTIQIDSISITSFVTSKFRLDGGTMFGVVPRAMWEKEIPADEHNRIALNSTSLLLGMGEEKILVEAGMGNKPHDKWSDVYDLENLDIGSCLSELGTSVSEIDTVILTHLHVPHAGGSTSLSDSGLASPTFSRARYVIQESELKEALDPHPLVRDYYDPRDYELLQQSGQLDPVSGNVEVTPGVRVELTGGHTPGHQLVRVQVGDEEILYLGDLVPTMAHLEPGWIMSWDIDPKRMWSEKRRILEHAAEKGSLVFLSHDPVYFAGRVQELENNSFRLVPGSGLEY